MAGKLKPPAAVPSRRTVARKALGVSVAAALGLPLLFSPRWNLVCASLAYVCPTP